MSSPPDYTLTVDELAARASVSVRTVRFYAGRGLLPPPQLEGRLGRYGAVHLARLELVRELQRLGYTLAAIEKYLERIPLDATPDEIALHRALLAPWVPEDAEELDQAELERRIGRPVSDAEIDTLAALGVLKRTDGRTVAGAGQALLSSAVDLLDLDLPPALTLAAAKIVEKHTGALATELQAAFQDHVLRPYAERGKPAEERERLRALMEKLKPVTVQAVVTAFQAAVNQAIRASLPRSSELPQSRD